MSGNICMKVVDVVKVLLIQWTAAYFNILLFFSSIDLPCSVKQRNIHLSYETLLNYLFSKKSLPSVAGYMFQAENFFCL